MPRHYGYLAERKWRQNGFIHFKSGFLFSPLLFALWLFMPVGLLAQNIENVVTEISGNNIIITYDIKNLQESFDEGGESVFIRR